MFQSKTQYFLFLVFAFQNAFNFCILKVTEQTFSRIDLLNGFYGRLYLMDYKWYLSRTQMMTLIGSQNNSGGEVLRRPVVQPGAQSRASDVVRSDYWLGLNTLMETWMGFKIFFFTF